MRTLGMALGMAQRATASGARLFEILDREPRIVVAARARRRCRAGAGRVELRDVTLALRGRARAGAARRRRSTSPAGRTVALVGATGSGKTTLVALLPRLYDATAGAVLIDGADVRDVDPASLRRADRASSTTTRSCSAPAVHENIAYARPDATREEVERAARRAQAHELHRSAARRLRHARRRARADALAAASASGSRSRARCSPTRGSSILDDATSSASTRRPSSRSSPRCAR